MKRFFIYNLEHYALAIWGLRLRLDPAFPWVHDFLPNFITDSVLEYRTYGLVAMWAGLLAVVLPLELSRVLIVVWAVVTGWRCRYLVTALRFWRQASRENQGIPHRSHARYVGELLKDIERRMKAGKPFQDQQQEAFVLVEGICRQPADDYSPGAILERKRGV